ncbi:uncharacterized protein LOC120821457 [Gasterosteus aculeatus]
MDRVRTSQSRHNVTGTLPLGQREKISRYFQSSVGHDGQHKVSEAPADEDSESGNSLFLTQADVTLPVAGRSGGQRHDNTRAKPTFPTDLEERDDRSLSSSSDEGQWRRKKCSLPIFNFPFLESQKRRPRRSPFPDQNKDLHMYMIGGFFKCLGELRQSGERGPAVESSLPTVDVDGEHISPLSEEDGERSEDEDIKVVGIKEFVALSTKRSKQNWCNQLKKQHRGKGTNTGNPPQTETCYNKQIMPSVSSDANSSGIGKSSCKVLAQKGTTAKQATVDANSLATTDTRKTKRCLARGDGNVSFLQKANEGQKTCNGNDAGVLKSQKSLRHATQKGSEASQPVTGREGDGQEVDGNVESEVRVENDGKKKRTKRSGADVEHLQPSTAAEPPNDCVNIQKKKKKKRKKDLGIVVTEERKAKGALNRSLDLPAVSMEQLRESENCLDIVATSQETSGLSFVKRKKDKKKQQSLSNDAPDKGKEVVDVSCYLDDPVTTAKDSRATPKKKKTIFEEINDSFSTKKKKKSEGVSGDKYEDTQAQSDYSASTRKKEKKSSFPVADVEENKVPTDSKLGAASAPHVGGPEELEVMASDQEELLNGVTEQKKKKKKKKKSEGVSRDKYEDTQAQSDYSASTRKKEKKKKKKSSFPVADVEKNEVPTDSELGAASAPCVGGPEELEVMASDQEELLNGVTEQKKKRKTSVVQDRVEEDHEQNRQEPGKTHRKRKKKRAGSESEGLDGAPDAGFPPLDEASGLKKKKRRCDVIEQDPPTHNEATTEAPTSDERDLASLETPGNQALDTRNKKKKKIKNGGGESAESERREKKKRQERNEKSTVAETSDIMKNKHGKLKRKLFNPNDEFFTGY